ncbi:LuxR C-terminal-related transcriptional regulator [Cellulosimicrobium cellulans]|uniref:LuxR C-terminal-related transcriptional regulator n=1 Tax=Cellulosimicrobium cellulans TaxID=1710 RepID=UPI00380771F4
MASVKPRAERTAVARGADASEILCARTSVPELPATTVARPSVETLVASAVTRRLTLVSAGPGWGKTTAVARWARSATGPRVAWLTLEPFDDKPAAFWADVLSALRAAGAVPPGHPLETLVVPPRLSPALLRRVLAAVEQLPEPVVLVLDDFHHAARPDVAATVDDLLRYPLPLHLVLLTRVDPLVRLQRLRAQGEVAEVGAADLAFDAPAVTTLAAVHGKPLSASGAGRVLDETGGWAVGVRLRVEADDAASRARADRSAAEFLLAEVLDGQEPATRSFLLRTSVTSAVCPDLASALDPGAPAERLLPGLAAADGFVMTAGQGRTWYRYHPLLREMLLSQFRLEDPSRLRDAHRAAARWFARDGEALRALEHAAAAEDWPLVGEVFVEGAAVQLAGPHRETVADTLRRVPYATIGVDARLHLCAGALAYVDERFDAARHHVETARDLLDPVEEPAAAVLLGLLDASVARSTGDVRGIATAAGAALAAADAAPYPFPALETYCGLAQAHRAAGLAWCSVGPDPVTSSFPLTPPPGREGRAPQLFVLGARAAAALRAVAEGRLDEGERLALAVVTEAEPRGWDGYAHVRPAHAARAWVQYLRASEEALDRELAHALAADAGGREPASVAAVRLLQALVAADRGHAGAARHALVAADRALGPVAAPPVLADLWVRATAAVRLLDDGTQPALPVRVRREGLGAAAVVAVCGARELLTTGRTGAALRAVAGLADVEEGDVSTLVRVEAALVEASALARAGTRRVEVPLARALDLAATERLVRPFLTVVVRELRPALARAVAGRDDALAALLRAHLDPADRAPEPAPLVEPLTERELAILAVLPSMASNVEIAEDFFVSVNTVKAHLKSVYRKLGVSSRRDAVRRGRELGVVP